MGGNFMNDYFRGKKKRDEESEKLKETKLEIPTHDPYTGELNPLYEELTDKKNPLKK